jgi:4-hydroxybenzoate polyprenyltransferase
MSNPALAYLIGKKFPVVGVIIVAIAAPVGIVWAIISLRKESVFLVMFMALCFIAAIQQFRKLTAGKRQ